MVPVSGARRAFTRIDPTIRGQYHGRMVRAEGALPAEELDGLPVRRFAEAVRPRDPPAIPAATMPTHSPLHDADVYGHGTPTRLAHALRDVRDEEGDLPVSESIQARCFSIPSSGKAARD